MEEKMRRKLETDVKGKMRGKGGKLERGSEREMEEINI
jgi:hypothetical protein